MINDTLVWSPGSTTTSCSSNNSPVASKKKIQTIAQSTQTTPTKVPGDAFSSAPVLTSSSRFEVTPTVTTTLAASAPSMTTSMVSHMKDEPLIILEDVTSSEASPDLMNINNNVNLLDADTAICLSPSSMSEISIETAMTSKPTGTVFSPPSSPQLRDAVADQEGDHGNKFWTLPRTISMGMKDDSSQEEKSHPSHQRTLKRHETIDVPPSKTDFETLEKKYFTLPSSSSHQPSSSHVIGPQSKTTGVASASSLDYHTRSSLPSGVPSGTSASAPVLKYQGIGPVNEQGVPLSARSQVQEQHASDWYKSMYNRLHTLQRTRREDEPLRIKVKTRRPKGNVTLTLSRDLHVINFAFMQRKVTKTLTLDMA